MSLKVAIIPARSGSKRIPKKNIKIFCGKPMIAYSIEAALHSKLFDRVIVSTDCKDIMKIAENFGAEVPFTRPLNLSDDKTPTAPVIRHAVNILEKDYDLEAVCCIYATAPFIKADDLLKGYEKLQGESGVKYVFSATTYSFPIQRAIFLEDNREVKMFNPEHILTRSQDLIEAYHDVGQFYWGTLDAWKKDLPIFSSHSRILKIPRERAQDIDTVEDWSFAELLYKAQLN